MKKSLLLIATFALLVAGSCQRNEAETGLTLTFTSDKPALEAATRTQWDGQGIQWSAGDAIAVTYTADDAWADAFYTSEPLGQGGSPARFTVNGFPGGTGSGTYLFHAIYPAQAALSIADAPIATVHIPPVQTPAADSFDPSADLMAGVSDPFSGFPGSPVPLLWSRVTAHGDITLNNLDIAQDETLASVTFRCQEGADLTGDFWLDLADDINPESFAPTDGNLTANTVTVLPDNLPLQGGSLHCWISVMPATLTSLNVTVQTDKAQYVKTFTDIEKTFLQNARNILRISMSGAERISSEAPAPTHYVKVTEAPADWSGDYLIVYEEGSLVLDSDGDQKTHASVSIADGRIAYEAGKAYNIHIEKDGNGYTLQFGEQYFGLNSDKNALNLAATTGSDAYRWTFSESSGAIRLYNLGYPARFLQYNAGSGQFRCYSSAQKEVQFFRLDGQASGGGGGTTPQTPTVTTGGSSGITQTEVTLSASYTGAATYGGFLWGLSQDRLDNNWQAAYLNNGAFTVQIDGLGAGHTYYYQAYIAVLEGTEYQYYYGDIKSFTTYSSDFVISGDQPGWYETPLMNIQKSGNYLVNENDGTQYYAIHMCSGGEKGPGGKTARNYTVCYSGKYHCPLWIAAPRHSMYVGSAGRNDSYRQDPDIPSSIQYSSKSTGGGCNKGHMLGSAERTSSKATNRDVFYYTNIAPQLSSNFNTGGGRWNVLEEYVDTQVCADTLYEVIGCYFEKYTDAYGETQTPATISFCGRDDVVRPTMFYYILLRTKKGNSGKALSECSSSELQCVALVRAHVNVRQDVTARELMSVADLEKITGVTYFPNVPNAPKNTFSASDWDL